MTEKEQNENTALAAAKDFLEGYRMCVEMLELHQYERRRVGNDPPERIREDLLLGDEAYLRMQMYEVESLIGDMKNGREKLLLHYRYLRGLSIERAAALIGVSRRTGYRLHTRALGRASILLKRRKSVAEKT